MFMGEARPDVVVEVERLLPRSMRVPILLTDGLRSEDEESESRLSSLTSKGCTRSWTGLADNGEAARGSETSVWLLTSLSEASEVLPEEADESPKNVPPSLVLGRRNENLGFLTVFCRSSGDSCLARGRVCGGDDDSVSRRR